MTWKSALDRNRIDVLGLSKPELSAITPVLLDVREKTARILAKFIKENKGTEYQLHQHRALLYQLDEVLKTIEKDLPEETLRELKSGSKSASRVAVKNMESMINEGDQKFRGSVTSLRIPVAKVVTNVDRTVMGRYETSATRYAGEVGARIRRELAVGVIRGESIDQIASRLLGERRYDKLKGSATGVADEIATDQFFRSHSDAKRLVRTELNNAYTEAQLESLAEADEDDPGWKKRWDAANDRLVCDRCAALDGEIRALNENFSGGVQGPPLHPNDRCCIVPHRDEWGGGPGFGLGI